MPLFILSSVNSLWAHEGHDHTPAPGQSAVVSGPITLSEETIKNLGVESLEVNLAPLQRSLAMVARIEPLPEKHAQISAKFEGRVLEIMAKLGEKVVKGQPLLKLDPVMIGNPPVTLRSPMDGFVIRQNLTLGLGFTPETVLVEVADYHQVLAKGTTYESADLTEIKVGQFAKVKVDVYPNEIFTGMVQSVDVGLESEGRTFEVYVLLVNADLKLRPNMQASLALGLGEAVEGLAVPQRALLGDTGNYFIFVQSGQDFEKRQVVLGIKSGDQVEILEGLFPGERVVTQGNYQLQYASQGVKREELRVQSSEPRKMSWVFLLAVPVLLIAGVLFYRHHRKSGVGRGSHS